MTFEPRPGDRQLRIYSYEGDKLKTTRLPASAKGICMDKFGNALIASAGSLYSLQSSTQTIAQIIPVDKSGATFRLHAHSLSKTSSGKVLTVHVSPYTKRSEIVTIELDR